MTENVLDGARSKLTVHTYAEGLFAKLAHDLALACTGLEGRADAHARSVELKVPIEGFRVLGVLHGGRVDERALSASDRDAALDKMRREVFDAQPGEVLTVLATLDGDVARIDVRMPRGRTVRLTAKPRTKEHDGGIHVTATFDVSLAAMGAAPVKGPMGAFRVKDRVEVRVELVFGSPPAQPA